MEQSKFYQIKNITEHEYTLVGCDGSVITLLIQDVDKSASAFTIQDAKDGDVLAFKNNIGGIIICKSPTDYDTRSYCRLVSDSFVGKEESGWDSTLLYPATKEQRDLLFQKMKEAGYEWDADKKELRKIEQEENVELTDFESALFSAFSYAWQEYLSGKEVNVAEWVREHSAELLKAAREQKPACSWSEEDEEIMNDLLWIIEAYRKNGFNKIHTRKADRAENWLESLRERYTWKPSDEQMNLLEELVEDNNQRHFYTILRSLYEQLKKLVE